MQTQIRHHSVINQQNTKAISAAEKFVHLQNHISPVPLCLSSAGQRRIRRFVDTELNKWHPWYRQNRKTSQTVYISLHLWWTACPSAQQGMNSVLLMAAVQVHFFFFVPIVMSLQLAREKWQDMNIWSDGSWCWLKRPSVHTAEDRIKTHSH